jgi:hypothetical protein
MGRGRGFAEGGMVLNGVEDLLGMAQEANETEVAGKYTPEEMQAITETVMAALREEIPNSDEVIAQFVAIFGEEELLRLIQAMESAEGGDVGLVQGPGTGTSDSIPATINGEEPVRLSNNEFVVPADAVAKLGGGSPQGGADVLHQFVNNTRAQSPAAAPQMQGGIGTLA